MQKPKSKIPWALLLTASFLLFGTSAPVYAVPPMALILKNELHLTHVQTSFLFTIPFIMMVALPIPGGILADWIGTKKTIGIGAIIAAVGAALKVFAYDFSSITIFTFVFAFGYALIFPNMPKLVSIWISRERVGLATGIYSIAVPLGVALPIAITLPVVFPITNSLQGTFFIWALPSLVTTVLWWVVVREPPPVTSSNTTTGETMRRSRSENNTTIRQVLKNKNLWLVAIVYLLHSLVFFNWIGWAPALMVAKGSPPEMAALIASLTVWIGIPTVLLAPRLSDELGLRKPFLWISSLMMVFAPLWAIKTTVPFGWFLMAVAGLCFNARFVTILTISAEIVPKPMVSIGSGLIFSTGYIGSTIGPIIGGQVLDATGSLDVSLLVLSGVSVVTTILALKIPETGPKHQKRQNIHGTVLGTK